MVLEEAKEHRSQQNRRRWSNRSVWKWPIPFAYFGEATTNICTISETRMSRPITLRCLLLVAQCAPARRHRLCAMSVCLYAHARRWWDGRRSSTQQSCKQIQIGMRRWVVARTHEFMKSVCVCVWMCMYTANDFQVVTSKLRPNLVIICSSADTAAGLAITPVSTIISLCMIAMSRSGSDLSNV